MSIWKKLIYWIVVTVVMSALLAGCLYVVARLMDDSFIRDCVVFVFQAIYFLITYNLVMFNIPKVNKWIGKE